MGCLRLSYRQEGTSEESTNFSWKVYSKKESAQKKCVEYYRYGFQGQFSEEDSETGWNSFELRMYDPIIGRWLVPDPARQFWSPYNGVGNDPINIIDPDGGTGEPVSKTSAAMRGIAANRNEIAAAMDGVYDNMATFLDFDVVISASAIKPRSSMFDYMPGGKFFWHTHMGKDLIGAGNSIKNFFNPTYGLAFYNSGDFNGQPIGFTRSGNATGQLTDVTNGLNAFGLNNLIKSQGLRAAIQGIQQAIDLGTAYNLSFSNRSILSEFFPVQNGAFRGPGNKFVRGDTVFGYHGNYRLKSQNGDTLYTYEGIPFNPRRK